MRLALLQGASFSELRGDILALGVFCVLLLPLSLLVFGFAVRLARNDGSLTHY
jgi:ABC-2 type transport system permease protein